MSRQNTIRCFTVTTPNTSTLESAEPVRNFSQCNAVVQYVVPIYRVVMSPDPPNQPAAGETKAAQPRWRALLKELLIAAAVFAAVFYIGDEMRTAKQRGGGGNLVVASQAADFRLLDVQNNTVAGLNDYRGKPTILVFWGTWCPSCRDEMPQLEELHRSSNGQFNLVTVAHDPPAKLARYLVANPSLSLPLLVDPPGRVHRRYKVRAVPTTVILDREGKIVHDFVGAADMGVLRDHMADLR